MPLEPEEEPLFRDSYDDGPSEPRRPESDFPWHEEADPEPDEGTRAWEQRREKYRDAGEMYREDVADE